MAVLNWSTARSRQSENDSDSVTDVEGDVTFVADDGQQGDAGALALGGLDLLDVFVGTGVLLDYFAPLAGLLNQRLYTLFVDLLNLNIKNGLLRDKPSRATELSSALYLKRFDSFGQFVKPCRDIRTLAS